MNKPVVEQRPTEQQFCDCRVCTQHRRWMENLRPAPGTPAEAAFDEMLEAIAHAETDAAYYKAKLEGTWPK